MAAGRRPAHSFLTRFLGAFSTASWFEQRLTLFTSGGTMQPVRSAKWFGALLLAIVPFFSAVQVFADVTARISGTVTAPSGAAVEGAAVTATNVGTQVTIEQA